MPAVETARLMTWNVWWRFGPQWRERQAGLVETIGSIGADVVGLQETWGSGASSQAGEFADALGFHAAFAAPSLPPVPDPPANPDHAGVELGVGLLSRWPIVSAEPRSLPSRYRRAEPVSLVATVAHPAGPLHVIVTCLEWEPAFQDDRLDQGVAAARLATEPALDGASPVVLMGDLNAAPGSPVLRALDDALVDAWVAGGGDPAAVSLRSDHPFAPLEATELIDQRIDHIYLRAGQLGQRMDVTAPRLAGDPIDGLEPSDHRAVVCDLAWTVP